MNKTSAPLSIPEKTQTKTDPAQSTGNGITPPSRRENIATARILTDKTSQTLVDFQPKNPNLPEWRLQIQNTVRQRRNASAVPVDNVSSINGSIIEKRAEAANAVPEKAVSVEVNPTVANALRRIERSRQIYSGTTQGPLALDQNRIVREPVAQPKPIPFSVVTPTPNVQKSDPLSEPAAAPKPKLVRSFRIEKKSYDTNKLPPLEEHLESAEITNAPGFAEPRPETDRVEAKPIPRSIGLIDDFAHSAPAYELPAFTPENAEDHAPISVRMMAGLFDFVLIGIASVILLSPIISGSEAWLSAAGGLAFVSTFAIMMFLYLTACIGSWGRSFGMRLFSLELIDAEENAYPTIHQSAVNSAVFLLSCAFLGLGFLPMFFNTESRALHDIVSGTVMIRDQ